MVQFTNILIDHMEVNTIFFYENNEFSKLSYPFQLKIPIAKGSLFINITLN